MYSFDHIKKDSIRSLAGHYRRRQVRRGRAYTNAIQILAATALPVLLTQVMA